MKIPATNKLWFVVVTFSVAAILVFAYPLKSQFITSEETHRITRLSALPKLVVWAWERPESLRFINQQKIGVAFLSKTITLRGAEVSVRPRVQPLDIVEGTSLVAVARIEADRTATPLMTESQLQETAAEIVELSKLPNLTAIQIDFDATVSQRDFYRRLLFAVRSELTSSMPLSITALASWCAGDDWLSSLPVDEVVPMFFRLGVDKRPLSARLKSREDFLSSRCRSAAGVSVDEPVALPTAQRLYIFNPESWSQASMDSAMEYYKR